MVRAPRVAELADEAGRSSETLRLAELSRHTSKAVRIAVARNPAADDDTIARLFQDDHDPVRLAAATNLGERPTLQRLAIESSDPRARALLASTFLWNSDRPLPYDIQSRLPMDADIECRARVAETTNHLDLFETLLGDSDRAAEVRASAARGGVLFPDDEQLLRLARDRSAGVRWSVLFRVDRPREVIELIAEDSDELNGRHARLGLNDPLALGAEAAQEAVREARRVAQNLEPFAGS